MAKMQISAQTRTVLGKQVRKLRREGQLPAVVYGPAMQGTVQSLTLDTHEFALVYARAGSATLLDLAIEGGGTRPVLIHQVQHDATRRKLLHVDFLAPDMLADLTVAVPLAFTGESPIAEGNDGLLTQLVSELQVRALPDRIPAALEVDLSTLTEVGAQITAAQITLPTGVALVTSGDEVLARIDAPIVIAEPEPEVTEESEEVERTSEAEQAGDASAASATDTGSADKE